MKKDTHRHDNAERIMKQAGYSCKPGSFKKGGAVSNEHEHENAKEPDGDVPLKKGGKAVKAHGHKTKHRLDKRARGGKMKTITPSSPLSGAAPKEERPGFGKYNLDKESD